MSEKEGDFNSIYIYSIWFNLIDKNEFRAPPLEALVSNGSVAGMSGWEPARGLSAPASGIFYILFLLFVL
jgi:hypothetical protein